MHNKTDIMLMLSGITLVNLLTYLLTYSMQNRVLEKLTGSQLV